MGKGNSLGYSGETQWTQQSWKFGEVSEKLSPDKSSDLYMQSAQRIINAIPTELNNLKCMKNMTGITVTPSAGAGSYYDYGEVKEVMQTEFNFYIVISSNGTQTRAWTVNKETNVAISVYTMAYPYARKYRPTLVSNPEEDLVWLFLTVQNASTPLRFELVANSAGTIGVPSGESFYHTVRNPIRNRQKVKMGMYVARQISTTQNSSGLTVSPPQYSSVQIPKISKTFSTSEISGGATYSNVAGISYQKSVTTGSETSTTISASYNDSASGTLSITGSAAEGGSLVAGSLGGITSTNTTSSSNATSIDYVAVLKRESDSELLEWNGSNLYCYPNNASASTSGVTSTNAYINFQIVNDFNSFKDALNVMRTSGMNWLSVYPFVTYSSGNWYLGNARFSWSESDRYTTNSLIFYTKITNLYGKGTGTNSLSVNYPTTGWEQNLLMFGKTHTLNFGIMHYLNDRTSCPIHCEHQSRFVMSDGKYIYFSRVNDYNYFLNDTGDDDAFFVKLSTINGEPAKVLRLISGRGLWAITDKGIFLLGYNEMITSKTVDARLIIADECTSEAVDIQNTLFYLTTDNKIKAVQNSSAQRGYVEFDTFVVDKYNEGSATIAYLEEIVIDHKKYLFAALSAYDTNYPGINVGAYIYRELGVNLFSRISYSCPPKMIASKNMLGYNNKIYKFNDNNMQKVGMILNKPITSTTQYGYLMNDKTSSVSDVVVRFYEENNNAIKSVKISDSPIVRTPEPDGIFNIYHGYTFETLGTAQRIDIETNQNTSDLEIQTTEIFFKSISKNNQ